VVEEFWKGKLGPNPYGGSIHMGRYDRKYYDTYIVTVVHHDENGNVIMEEYTDNVTGETGERPATSIRAISYNPHQGDSTDVSEQTIIEDELLVEALKKLGKQLAIETKQKAPQALGKVSAKSYQETYKEDLDVKTATVDNATGIIRGNVTREAATPGLKGKKCTHVRVQGNIAMQVDRRKAEAFFTPEKLAALRQKRQEA
jgi:hypothetical protein